MKEVPAEWVLLWIATLLIVVLSLDMCPLCLQSGNGSKREVLQLTARMRSRIVDTRSPLRSSFPSPFGTGVWRCARDDPWHCYG